MSDKDLIRALRRMEVETGSLVCLGCGHEHSCSVHGCAIINEAVAHLARMDEPSNEPLALDELREMRLEPAWLKGIGRSGWVIIGRSSVENYVCIFWPGERGANTLSLDYYGDTWLAYRCKPENTQA